MIAYHGKAALKDAVLTIIGEHERMDRIRGGTYAEFVDGDDSKLFLGGCAVGCTLESIRRIEGLPTIAHDDHALYERYLGVPMMLARIEDRLFERLDGDQQIGWPRRFAEAIPVGADLSMVWPRWMRRVLADPAGAVQQRVTTYPAIGPSIVGVVALFDRWIATGEKPTAEAWREARSAAFSAESYAASAAAYAASAAAYAASAASAESYAASAAFSAAYAESYAASAAAYAASAAYADAADAADARKAEIERQADWLIDALQQADVPMEQRRIR